MEFEQIKEILKSALDIKPIEIGCDDCQEFMDEFVTVYLQKKESENKNLLLVKEHLTNCKFCNEEFISLLEALKRVKE